MMISLTKTTTFAISYDQPPQKYSHLFPGARGLAVTVITFPDDDLSKVGALPAMVEMTRGT